MPKSLYEGNVKVTGLTEEPEDPYAIPAADLNAGVDLSCAILRSGFRLSPTGSDTLSEPALCDSGNAVVFGSSNYEGTLTIFRYYDEEGNFDPDQDEAYQYLTPKGTFVWLVKRVGPPSAQDWADGDVYDYFPAVTDDRQDPTDLTGYVKAVIPLGAQGGVVLDGVVGGSGS